MRCFRLTLILLIVALLPVRGMLAAAMPCPPSSGSGVMTSHPSVEPGGHGDRHVEGGHGTYAGHGDPAGHHRSPPAAAPGDPGDRAGNGCGCAALCAAFPLATPPAGAPLPTDLAQAGGGEPLLPPLRLLAAPRERPPRSA